MDMKNTNQNKDSLDEEKSKSLARGAQGNLGAVKALKNLKPEKPKNYVHVFARGEEDFKKFAGGDTFFLNKGEFKGRKAFVDKENNTTFIYCWKEQQIQGLTNINYYITEGFKRYMGKEKIARVKREIEICNFLYADYIDIEKIPKVLREAMAEISPSNDNTEFPMPCVGMVIESRSDWGPLKITKHDRGIVVGLYGNNLENAYVIFDNGEHCGFNREEQLNHLKYLHLTNHDHILQYQYTTNINLTNAFNEGYFNAEFKGLSYGDLGP